MYENMLLKELNNNYYMYICSWNCGNFRIEFCKMLKFKKNYDYYDFFKYSVK